MSKSIFAVCIGHGSLVYQFEHSGKVRRAWFQFDFEIFYSSWLSGSGSFLCAALTSPQRMKQYCHQIEHRSAIPFKAVIIVRVNRSFDIALQQLQHGSYVIKHTRVTLLMLLEVIQTIRIRYSAYLTCIGYVCGHVCVFACQCRFCVTKSVMRYASGMVCRRDL